MYARVAPRARPAGESWQPERARTGGQMSLRLAAQASWQSVRARTRVLEDARAYGGGTLKPEYRDIFFSCLLITYIAY